MATLNKSRQREAILKYLESTKSHPTAETIYNEVKKEFPNISLGTVYRNLTLLTKLGQIQKLDGMGESDRFDFTATPHAHFICRECGCVIDLDVDLKSIDSLAGKSFDGRIDGHAVTFYGLCDKCASTNKNYKIIL